jgi:uncharacterized repeat protein (TIGR03803 family)
LHEFRHSADNPVSPVLVASDGNLYVTTFGGGDLRKGSIRKLTPDGVGGYSCDLLHSFDGAGGAYPRTGLMEATDGLLYGLTSQGGSFDFGVAFRISTSGSFELLHSFSGPDGRDGFGELVQASDGNFYGTTALGGVNDGGVLFRMDAAGTVTVLYAFTGFTGSSPQGGLLVGPDGFLYGSAAHGGADGLGTLFRVDLNGDFTLLHSFSVSEGANPTGALAFEAGFLYGTTSSFAPAAGTIYRMDLSGNFSTLHVFSGPDGYQPLGGLTAGGNGFLYGTTWQGGTLPGVSGLLFRADAGGTVTTLHEFTRDEGLQPAARPTLSGSDLVGTTTLGGPNFDGTVYRRATDGTLTVLCALGEGEGQQPVDVLHEATDGMLYGTTFWGGNYPGEGTVFRLSKAGALTTLHSFTGLDGRRPYRGLLQGPDGNLFGTTSSGGFDNAGTAFRLDLAGQFTLLHTFIYFYEADPPSGQLTIGPDQNIYGPAAAYGDCGAGMIYRLDLDGTVTPIHSFCGNDGAYPFDRLISASDGNLYGATSSNVFRLATDGSFASLHFFGGGPEGGGPAAGVMEGPDGNLYGSTVGSSTTHGTLFRLTLAGRVLMLHVFPQDSSGTLHKSALLRSSDGYFYGTTSTDYVDMHGEVFRINRYGDYAVVHSFQGSDGHSPTGLIEASDGNIYGTTNLGGPDNVGVAYRLVNALQAVALTPSSGPATDPNPFVLTGRGFQVGASVSVGGQAAADVVVSDPASLSATTPILFPGTLNDVVVTNPDSSTGTLALGWLADFLDVPPADPFHDYIERMVRFHVAVGYGTGFFGRDDPVTRSQMAPFLLKGSFGPVFTPPPCNPFLFSDVDCSNPFAGWIAELYYEGITAGCQTNPLAYCPDAIVTRATMAVLLLKALHGSAYQPPACTGLFEDVSCQGGFAADWIEQLYNEGITAGCNASPLRFCPDAPVSRGEMAVFIVRAFGL